MSPARPTTDTIGPMTRTVRDAAILFDVIVGYDRNDRVTALGVRQIPETYTSSLRVDGLRNARVGVIREPMTRLDIADRVGASREMVSRILRDLTTGGYIATNAGRILILKRPPSAW